MMTDVEYGNWVGRVKKFSRLCSPANKNGEDPTAALANEHLVGYMVKRQSGFPKFERRREILVFNQFHPGGLLMDIIKPDLLLLPSAKALGAPPGPLAEDFNHFKCYKVAKTRFRSEGTTIEDQFFGPFGVDPNTLVAKIKKPKRLCIPATKEIAPEPPTPVFAPLTSLMCYQIKTVPKRLNIAGIFIDNQFDSREVEITHPKELCVPSAIDAFCGNDIADTPVEECDGLDAPGCPGNCIPPGLPNSCTCS